MTVFLRQICQLLEKRMYPPNARIQRADLSAIVSLSLSSHHQAVGESEGCDSPTAPTFGTRQGTL